MDNILLLTDFSPAAFHAARYAAALTQQYHVKELILYHAYEILVPTWDIPVVSGSSMVLYEDSLRKLKTLHNDLQEFVYAGTNIRYRSESGSLAASINEIAREEHAGLIVMGLTGKSKIEHILSGNDNFRVSDECNHPVLLVPERAIITPVERIVFACDLQEVVTTIPEASLKKILDDLHAALFVVNVDYRNIHFSPKTPLDQSALHTMLASYQPTFHYIENKDLEKGILAFAMEHQASLILTIRKTHGFFQGLFHHSVTHHLAQQTPIPLLVLHERNTD
jgi:nucleotide-binding universal stress UspA family protein